MTDEPTKPDQKQDKRKSPTATHDHVEKRVRPLHRKFADLLNKHKANAEEAKQLRKKMADQAKAHKKAMAEMSVKHDEHDAEHARADARDEMSDGAIYNHEDRIGALEGRIPGYEPPVTPLKPWKPVPPAPPDTGGEEPESEEPVVISQRVLIVAVLIGLALIGALALLITFLMAHGHSSAVDGSTNIAVAASGTQQQVAQPLANLAAVVNTTTAAPTPSPTAQPKIPDGGIIKCGQPERAARRCEITIGLGLYDGNGNYSDPVYTGEKDSVVYTFAAVNGTKLSDNFIALFPDGGGGKANASDSFGGKWNPKGSPLRLGSIKPEEDLGKTIVITW